MAKFSDRANHLNGERLALKAENERLRTQLAIKDKALAQVEWLLPNGRGLTMLQSCPICFRTKLAGHAHDCVLATAPSPNTTARVKISASEIEAAQTPAGGWTRETLAKWGVPWPPPSGWKKALIEGTTIPNTTEEQRG